MLLKPLALAAAGLAATQAFLIPPEISQSDVDTVKALPIEAFVVPQEVSLNLSCPGCLRPHNKAEFDTPSHLELTFLIDHGYSGDRLLVNGFPLYPIGDSRNPHARLVPDEQPEESEVAAWKQLRGHRRPHRQPPRRLGFELITQFPKAGQHNDNLNLAVLDFQIVQVGRTLVSGIPNVHITLVVDGETGAVAIGNIETTESKTAIDQSAKAPEECSTLMCTWMAKIEEMMKAAKETGRPCGGKMHGGSKGSHPHHNGHHHHQGGRPHWTGGDARHHSWGQLFKNIAAHILLPIAVGIVAGVSVSLIGMMVGTLIVSIWRAFFRRPGHRRTRSRGHSHSYHKASKREFAAAEVEEKSGLMEHQDPPPSYEEEVSSKTGV